MLPEALSSITQSHESHWCHRGIDCNGLLTRAPKTRTAMVFHFIRERKTRKPESPNHCISCGANSIHAAAQSA